MSNETMTDARALDEFAQDLRHLIVCDTQFGWSGETTLKLPEIERLVARGWLVEGHENAEYDVTDEGRAIIAARLRGEAAQQSCQFCGGTKGHWEGCRAPIESPKWASMDGALRVLVAQCNRIDGDAVRSVDGSIAIPAGAWEAFSGALGAAVGALQFKDTAQGEQQAVAEVYTTIRRDSGPKCAIQHVRLLRSVPDGTKLYAALSTQPAPSEQVAARQINREFVEGVKQLCRDYSCRQNRPYMGDVFAQLDYLAEQLDMTVAPSEQVADHEMRPDTHGCDHAITCGFCRAERSMAASVAVPDEAIRQALVTHVPRVTDKKVETIIRYIRKLAAAPVAPEREG